MSRKIILLAAVGALMACTAAAQPSELASPAAAAALDYADPSASDVDCDIRVSQSRHGVRFLALGSADGVRPVDYELVITKHDRGGSSDIVQSGATDLTTDEQVLGEAEISLERNGSFDARLVVSEDGDTVCEAAEAS